MFYANILIHDKGFDPNSSPTRNMALTTGIPSDIKKHGLFFTFIAYIMSKMEKKIKNLATKHHNFPQGCIVKPIKGVGQNLLRGV
jgi:hypothetical protein